MQSSSDNSRSLATRLCKMFGNEYVLLLIFSVLIGLAVSHGIAGFRKLIGLFQLAAFDAETEKYFGTVVASSSWWHLLLAPTPGGLMAGLFIYYFMPG